jgi:hypothetical protein
MPINNYQRCDRTDKKVISLNNLENIRINGCFNITWYEDTSQYNPQYD